MAYSELTSVVPGATGSLTPLPKIRVSTPALAPAADVPVTWAEFPVDDTERACIYTIASSANSSSLKLRQQWIMVCCSLKNCPAVGSPQGAITVDLI